MDYLSISNDEHLAMLAESLIAREAELFNYNLNIANYERILEKLPDGESPVDATYLEQDSYKFAAELRQRVVTERIQRARSLCVYDAIISQLPSDTVQRQELIAAAKSRISTAA